ncbi:MAG: autotransporter outer membrane beta-barrel domain-containing protein [Glycocaulis sp.]
MNSYLSASMREKLLVGVAGAALALAMTVPALAQTPEFAAILYDDDVLDVETSIRGDNGAIAVVGNNTIVNINPGAEVIGEAQFFRFPEDVFLSAAFTGAILVSGTDGVINIGEGASVTGGNYGILGAEGEFVWELGVPPQYIPGIITINNHGDITANLDDGVRIFNRNFVINNSGTITGSAEYRPIEERFEGKLDSLGDGISFAYTSLAPGLGIDSLYESGIGTEIYNTGEIYGRRFGIIGSGGAYVQNDGLIFGQASGVLLQPTDVNVSDAEGNFIELVRPPSRAIIINRGEILAEFDSGAQAYASHHFTVEHVDNRALEGTGWLDYFAGLDADDFGAVILNSGLIETFATDIDTETLIPIWGIDPNTGQQIVIGETPLADVFTVSIIGQSGYLLNTADGIIRGNNGANSLRLSANDTVCGAFGAGNQCVSALQTGGTINVINQGLMIGDIVVIDRTTQPNPNQLPLTQDSTFGQVMFYNNGLIDGNVQLGGGDDLFYLGADGEVTGIIDLGEGDDVMIWDSRGKVGGTVSGGGGSNLLAIILGGNQFDGERVFNFQTVRTFGQGNLDNIDLSLVSDIEVSGGTNINLGTTGFAGALIVGLGGQVSGVGTVGSIGVDAGGTVSPGNSIGTINVVGNFALAAGSTFDVEVSPLGSDQVLAGGTASLGGAFLNVTGEDGNDLAPGTAMTSYVIVEGAAGLTGTFGPITNNLRFYDPVVQYSGTQAVLVLEPVGADFIAHAQTANQLALGTVLYDALLPASGDFLQAMKDSFPGLSADGVRQGLDVMSGPVHGFVPVAASEAGIAALRSASGQGIEGARGDTRAWVSGFYSPLDIDATSRSVGADVTSSGVLLGMNGNVSDFATIGVFGGFVDSHGDDDTGANLDSDGWMLGALARFAQGQFSVGGQLAYLSLESTVSRRIAVGGLSRPANSSYDTTGWVAGVDAAFDLALSETTTGTLFADVAWASMDSDAFAEAGAGSLSLSAGERSFTRTTYRIGGRLGFDLGAFQPSLEAGYLMNTGGRAVTYTAEMAGLPGQGFAVRGTGLGANAVFGGVGLGFDLASNVTANLGYRGNFGGDMTGHDLTARVGIRF